MGKRVDLQALLETTLGSEHVYFQPPESVKMEYPCIIYSLDSGSTIFANDLPYKHDKCYSIKVIDKNPDSIILDKIAMLPKMCI